MRYCRPLMVTLTWDMTTLHAHATCNKAHSSNAHRASARGSHAPPQCSCALKDRPDGIDRDIEATGNLAVGLFELAGPRRLAVEIGGEAGAVEPERVHLR